MTYLQELEELTRIASSFKKEMTKNMMANNDAWKKFKADNKKYFDTVKYPQTAISDLAVKHAWKVLGA